MLSRAIAARGLGVRIITPLILLFCVTVNNSIAQEDDDYDYTYFNPGIRIGYTFGRGVTFGFEVSLVANNGFFAGVSSGLDYTIGAGGSVVRLYLEGELGILAAGFGYGGAVLFEGSKVRLARQFSLFGGWPIETSRDDRYGLMIPYYRMTYPGGEDKSVKELGTFFKISYPIGKGDFGNRYQIGT